MTVRHRWPPALLHPSPPCAQALLMPTRLGPEAPGATLACMPPPCGAVPGRFASHFHLDLPALAKVRPALVRHAQGLRAGTAELLLLNRLRAHTRRDAGKETLERAALIIEVTARHWFGQGPAPSQPA